MHSSPETISNKHAELPLLCRGRKQPEVEAHIKGGRDALGGGETAHGRCPIPGGCPRTPSLHPGPSFAQST